MAIDEFGLLKNVFGVEEGPAAEPLTDPPASGEPINYAQPLMCPEAAARSGYLVQSPSEARLAREAAWNECCADGTLILPKHKPDQPGAKAMPGTWAEAVAEIDRMLNGGQLEPGPHVQLSTERMETDLELASDQLDRCAQMIRDQLPGGESIGVKITVPPATCETKCGMADTVQPAAAWDAVCNDSLCNCDMIALPAGMTITPLPPATRPMVGVELRVEKGHSKVVFHVGQQEIVVGSSDSAIECHSDYDRLHDVQIDLDAMARLSQALVDRMLRRWGE